MSPAADRDLRRPAEPGRVAAVLAVDPVGLGGLWLRSPLGPERDSFLDTLQELTPERRSRKVPMGTGPDRLFGGLDLAGTLAGGRPSFRPGLLADAHGGWLTLPDASGLEAELWGPLLAVLDGGEVVCERGGFSRVDPAAFSVLALDEGRAPQGDAGEGGAGGRSVPEGLADRLAFWLAVPPRYLTTSSGWSARAVRDAADRAAELDVPEESLGALVGAAAALGVRSLRAPVLALRAARAHAALHQRDAVAEEDVLFAVRAVLVPRGTGVPAPPPEEHPEETPDESEPPDSPDDRADDPPDADEEDEPNEPSRRERLADRVVEAVRAALPELEERGGVQPTSGSGGRGGRRGERIRAPARRGRVRTVRPGDPRDGRPLDLLATIRAAAPWQPLRRSEEEGREGPDRRLRVRPADLRVRHMEAPQVTSTVFVVDGSGSHAVRRLAEAKGAVELLLARSYVRREEVGLVLFRNRGAELALPLTRSLARARRVLAGLPGGGGTPVAAGLDLGLRVALEARRSGSRPRLVVLTDGKANVNLDGQGGRRAAFEDALGIAARIRAQGVELVVLDTSARGQENTERLAAAAGGSRHRLPVADARAVHRVLGGVDRGAEAAGGRR